LALEFLMDVGWSKQSGSPGTTWVELLVLELRLGQTLLSPWWVVTSP